MAKGKKKKKKKKSGKAMPVTGRGDPQGCETSRLPHSVCNRFTDGGDVVSFRRLDTFYVQV
jgi:hypothetical protein